MDVLTKMKSLLKKASTAADIEAAIAAVDLDTLRADLARATAERTELLLSGGDAEIIAAEKRIEVARLAHDRAEAAKAELEGRLPVRRREEAKAAFDKRHAAAVAARDKAIARIEKDYGAAARLILDVIDSVKQADAQVEAVNSEITRGNSDPHHPGHDLPAMRTASAEYWRDRFFVTVDIGGTALFPTADTPATGRILEIPARYEGRWAK